MPAAPSGKWNPTETGYKERQIEETKARAQTETAGILAGASVASDFSAIVRTLVASAGTSPLLAATVALILADVAVSLKLCSSGTRGLIQGLIVSALGVDLAAEILGSLPIPFSNQGGGGQPALFNVPATVVQGGNEESRSEKVADALASVVKK